MAYSEALAAKCGDRNRSLGIRRKYGSEFAVLRGNCVVVVREKIELICAIILEYIVWRI
jgi:hypothetical protein